MEQNKQSEITENYRNADGTFAKGNPGRPKGTLNFSTKFRMFLEKVAEQNKKTTDEIEEQLFKVAFKKARDGDYSFYKDIFDRVYGKPVQPVEDLTPKDEPDIKKIFNELKQKAKEDDEAKDKTINRESA